LGDYGFRCVIAPSFADIFNGNCFQNGILPVILPEETVQQIIEKAEKDPGYKLHVDLEAQRVWDDSEEVVATFDLEPFRRYSLLNGLDDIGLTMEREDDISKFESQRGIHGGVVTG
jgi:3-isopropylmalate/(R)-2-methylmalate dehydratase small subunit